MLQANICDKCILLRDKASTHMVFDGKKLPLKLRCSFSFINQVYTKRMDWIIGRQLTAFTSHMYMRAHIYTHNQ